MELYSMPQLDKTSPYSDIHYVERSNLPSTSIPVDVKKFSPVSDDILTSSAWSAVIHRPAEDSEPEDLPSTVDMDAIKGSPSTSLPTSGPLGWSEGDRGNAGSGDEDSESGDDDDDDEEDDDDEDDNKQESSSDNESSSPNSDGDDADSESGTAHGSASDSDSESSSKNSYDSDSSASSDSSCSSRSSESSQSSSSPTHKPFPGRESGKHSSSQELQHCEGGPKSRVGSHRNDKNEDSNKAESVKVTVAAKVDEKSDDRRSVAKKDDDKLHRKDGKEERASYKQEALRHPVRGKVEGEEDRGRDKTKEAPKPSTLRAVRRKDTVSSCKTKSCSDEVSSTRPNVGAVSTSSVASSLKNAKINEENKSDHKTSMSISSSTTQTSTSAVSSAVNDSSSDMELPDQVVSDAIKRIHVEAKGKADPSAVNPREEDDDGDSSDGADSKQRHYSSSLLQKFVESTERLSGKHSPARVRSSGTNKHSATSGKGHTHKDTSRRKHGPPAPVRPADVPTGLNVRGGPADLEVYCSVSNVSPDSGIYCVNGSPWHQSSPAHSPQHPPQQLLKTRPSSPRGPISQDHRRKHTSLSKVPISSSKSSRKTCHQDPPKDVRVPPIPSIDDSDEDTTSSTLLLPAPARRGRGRPKKTPPILEPSVPYNLLSSSKHIHKTNQGGPKSRKQMNKIRKESESSDQSEERCDKTLKYSTHRSRSRDVQVTSQGVQCDQSEFALIERIGTKKKKKNQACQSYDVSQIKTSNVLKPSSNRSSKEKDKLHKKLETLQTVCDRVKKSHDVCTYRKSSVSKSKLFSSHSSKDAGSVKSSSRRNQDSPSPSCNRSHSSSKRRPQPGVEKRKRDLSEIPAARLAAAAAVLLSSSSSTSLKSETPTSGLQTAIPATVRSATSQRAVEKVVSLPRGLHRKHKKHHRHKDRKEPKESRNQKGRKQRSARSVHLDPKFFQELEKLISDFQRFCCIARFQQPSRLSEGTRLPSIFRIRKILKKRKGSERSKNSDRDSGPEVENTNPTGTPAARDIRDKGSSGGKRRPKKNAVETPKGLRPEANNEQRLPLKKRHYHMSTAPNHQSSSTSSPDVSPTSSVSSKTSAASAGSQGSQSQGKPGSSAMCTSSLPNKAGLSPVVSNQVSETEISPCIVSCSAKSILPPVCTISNSKVSISNTCLDKDNILMSNCTSEKVTLVMPATSSSVLVNDCHPTETGILSKANTSASFASVSAKSDSIPSYQANTSTQSESFNNSVLCDGSSSLLNSAASTTAPVPFLGIPAKTPRVPDEKVAVCKSDIDTASSPKVSSTKSMAPPQLKSVQVASNSASVKSAADSSLPLKSTLGSALNKSACSNSLKDDADVSDLNSTSSSSLSTVDAVSSVIPSNMDPNQVSNVKGNLVNHVSGGKLVRASYDDAIEACIRKYSKDGSPAGNVTPRSVITTPKKRHRMEMQGKPGGGKGKDVDASVHSTTGSTPNNQTCKKTNSRSVSTQEASQSFVQTKPSPHLPTPQAVSPGGSKLPESGIFEPSSSSEHYVVNVSLPATPVKSVITGLSKLKSASSSVTCYNNKPISASTPEAEGISVVSSAPDSFALTCHNLRQKKNTFVNVADTLEGNLEASKHADKPSMPLQLPTVDKSNLLVKTELDLKSKTRSKPKLKQADSLQKTHQAPEGGETGMKTEDAEVGDETGPSSNELKELRIHVEKLSNETMSFPKEKDKSSKQLKTNNAVPKRRRKCNRTGFPVKRKRKKKESSVDEVKTEEEFMDNDSSDISSFNQELSGKEQNNMEQTSVVGKTGSLDHLKEESCDPNVKIERKKETVMLEAEESVSNSKDCKDIKQEHVTSDITLNALQGSSKCGETCTSGSEDISLPYIDRIPNKEKYMYAGFAKRSEVKPNNKVRKPSKAVIRAMRAKFSENIPVPEQPQGNAKGSKLASPNWSSDESDDSVDDPYEFNESDPPETGIGNGVMKGEPIEKCSSNLDDGEASISSDSSRKRPKRDMKRRVAATNDEPIKRKFSKSDKEENKNAARKKRKTCGSDMRRRNKRKIESDEMLPLAESRNAPKRRRLRTIQRLEVDSADTDCESILGEPPVLSSNAVADTVSEDEGSKTFSKDCKQPRWRKKYLPAGLFSDYYKLDEPRPVTDGKKNLQYRPEDHPYGLLPPPFHCEKLLRQKKVPFQLPYDLWWLHTHNKLPGRDIVPSWNYKKIRTNVYYNVKPSYLHEPQACNCKNPDNGVKGCGDDCINRLVYTECSPGICLLRDQCSNQKIQRHDWAPGLERFMTKEKGWGVRAKLPIKSGEFILEYVGEVVSDREFKERMASIYTQDTHHYCLHLDGGLVIDGHRMGGDGRFVNHSCEPNCEMQKWSVNGLFRMALFALRDIDANEELGYDYNFSLFNAAEGQPCKCGSNHCRGVIGGKSQRVNVLPSTQNGSSSKVSVQDLNEKKGSRKNKRKANRKNDKEQAAENLRQRKRIEAQRLSQLLTLNIRQMSHQQRCFVQQHHCFLLRNLEKVRRLKERLKLATERTENSAKPSQTNVKQSDVFLTQLNALSIPRNVRTRRLAQAEDNPELARNARLACVLRDLFNAVVTAKDEKGETLSSPFMTLPNKRKLPRYYVRIRDPLDFSTIEHNITSGLYCTLEAFDQDICKVLNNNLKYYGRTDRLGIASVRLNKIYLDAKKEVYPQLVDVLGETLPQSFVAEKDPAEEEDVIRCICGLYRDEGMMIQCERCLVWQHCDCVQADSSFEHYLCEVCQPRPVDLEIVMDPQPSHSPAGHTDYLTLLRSDLQIRQGDTVYVLRDITEGEGESQTKVTYKTIKDPKYGDMDIFRIERLWKDEKGDRFAYGHHYLRPHETYHEPTRKFYPNEVMRVPLFEIIPLDLIWARCWVLDPMTYCKGRPIEAVEEHVYICEYRVDKSAHLFYKISRSQCRANLCLKSYAFETFETRLKPVRTYTPHGPVPTLKPRARCGQDDSSSTKSLQQTSNNAEEEEEVPLARREKQCVRLNGILLRLLGNQQCKQPLDMSYLLDAGRRPRKKPSNLNT